MRIKIRALSILVVFLIILSGCTQKQPIAQPTKVEKTSEQLYYEAIDTYEVDDREIIERYTDIIVKYAGLDIPEAEWDTISDLTDESYKGDIREWFPNKALKTIEKGEAQSQIGGEYQSESGELSELEITDTEDKANSQVIQSLYIFKSNKYIMKIGTPSGYVYLLEVRLQDGLVVGVNEV